jgi:hypothetical protein
MIMTDMRGQLAPGTRSWYVLAGNAIITLQSVKTETRFTYKVRIKETKGKPSVHFVKVLTGPDNNSSYTYLGTRFSDGDFRVTRKSKISPSAPSALAFSWFNTHMESKAVTVWHEGRCGCCGRRLTVPESIASGIGPICEAKMRSRLS